MRRSFFLFLNLFSRWCFVRHILWRWNRIDFLRRQGVKIGRNCRIYNASFGTEPYLIRLGDHVHVGENVQFITHDGGVWVVRWLRNMPELDSFGPIEIGDNVFVGNNVILLPGIRVGCNCVIGAGTVVTKDIPSGSIAVGVPARVVNSIEDYAEKKITGGFPTKGLSGKMKKQYLETLLQKQNAE